jgi:hypothetical protein
MSLTVSVSKTRLGFPVPHSQAQPAWRAFTPQRYIQMNRPIVFKINTAVVFKIRVIHTYLCNYSRKGMNRTMNKVLVPSIHTTIRVMD